MIQCGCPEVKKLEELYNKLCIEKFHKRRDKEDPTTQETDRSAIGRKGEKK